MSLVSLVFITSTNILFLGRSQISNHACYESKSEGMLVGPGLGKWVHLGLGGGGNNLGLEWSNGNPSSCWWICLGSLGL